MALSIKLIQEFYHSARNIIIKPALASSLMFLCTAAALTSCSEQKKLRRNGNVAKTTDAATKKVPAVSFKWESGTKEELALVKIKQVYLHGGFGYGGSFTDAYKNGPFIDIRAEAPLQGKFNCVKLQAKYRNYLKPWPYDVSAAPISSNMPMKLSRQSSPMAVSSFFNLAVVIGTPYDKKWHANISGGPEYYPGGPSTFHDIVKMGNLNIGAEAGINLLPKTSPFQANLSGCVEVTETNPLFDIVYTPKSTRNISWGLGVNLVYLLH